MAVGKLTALKVKSLVQPGRYGDGGGLWLQVRTADQRSWLFRYKHSGKARHMGLGPATDITLAEARAKAMTCRKELLDGIDPLCKRSQTQAAARTAAKRMTFREVAESYLLAHEATWKHPKHRSQWRGSLDRYAFPILGDLAIDQVGTGDVMRVLDPIWREKTETASRVRQRMEALLDFAKTREWRAGDNPARWRGHIENLLPKRSKARSTVHYSALPWKEMGAFMAAIRAEPGTGALALEFTVLTATRTNETLGAVWGEIDLDAGTWTIPAGRMKAGREHRVPLTAAALDVLGKAAKLRKVDAPVTHVFPGSKPEKPLSNMAMAMLLRRMKRGDLTVHGFRSSFRDWVSEATDHIGEVAEAALAHSVIDKVEAAYRRGDLFEKRRRLMEDWAVFCGGSGK